MSASRKVICIVCPNSCIGEVSIEAKQKPKVHGYICARGKSYAVAEATNPLRMLTTTVRVRGGVLPLLPVVSSAALPKDCIAVGVQMLSEIVVDAPIKAGQVVYAKLLGLSVDIVASRDIAMQTL
ncbi:MAG: hypothetical protein DDT39_00158 [Firmicutes bacterium]|nr:hypothetical protein [candidate division NPL-UPA2 bacterium]MBT9153501.1 hypothetical protein [candidate division NPL-UPA2 bacterium]